MMKKKEDLFKVKKNNNEKTDREKDPSFGKFAHKNSFDNLTKRTKKRYIFEGIPDRSVRTGSWRDKNIAVDTTAEEDKSYTIVKNIKKETNFDQYKKLRDKAITSYGIILYTWIRKDDKKELQFLLPQRRDTIHYMEFPRYKGDEKMLPKIISLMTKEEKRRIMECYNSNRLVDLWFDLWINKRSRAFKKEFKSALENYKCNTELYKHLLMDDTIGLDECPWQFSKGRKHWNETELDCAVREFEEETGIKNHENPKNTLISVLPIKPYEDIYVGSDGKLYRNVFYIAYLPFNKYHKPEYRSSLFRKYITEETQEMKWMTFDQCMEKISDTQKVVLTDLNNYLNYGYMEPKVVKRKSF